MGVYIRGMEMPTSCFYCPMREWHIIHGEKITSCRAAKTLITNEDERPSFCPLVPVPEHGRLIDADDLLSMVKRAMEDDDMYEDDYRDVRDWLAVTPTIIPADKGVDE